MAGPLARAGLALRLARRGMLRNRWTALLGIVLLALPVAALAGLASMVASDPGEYRAPLEPVARIRISDMPCDFGDPGTCLEDDRGGQRGRPIADRLGDALGPATAARLEPEVDFSAGLAAGAGAAEIRMDARAVALPPAAGGPAPGTVLPSAEQARALGLHRGDELRVRVPGVAEPLRLRMAGIGAGGDSEAVLALADVPGVRLGGEARYGELPADLEYSWRADAVPEVRPGFGVALDAAYDPEYAPGESGSRRPVLTGLRQLGYADAATRATVVAAGALALVLVAATVTPLFAVSARRRRRELALLAATGARPARLRAVMLAEGLLTGLGAAVLGGLGSAVLGLAGFRLVREAHGAAFHWAADAWALLALAAVLCACAAAALPAIRAGREEPALGLADGSAAYRPRRGRLLWAGPALLLIALLALVAEAPPEGAFWLPVAALGTVASAPALLRGLVALGPRLPLPARLALRDADRSAQRVGAAIAAVAGVVFIAVGSYGYLGAIPSRETTPVPLLAAWTATAPSSTAGIDADLDRLARSTGAIGRIDVWNPAIGGELALVRPERPDPEAVVVGPEAYWVPRFGVGEGVLVADPGVVRVLAATDADGMGERLTRARRVLAAGGAVVADESVIRDGRVTVRVCGGAAAGEPAETLDERRERLTAAGGDPAEAAAAEGGYGAAWVPVPGGWAPPECGADAGAGAGEADGAREIEIPAMALPGLFAPQPDPGPGEPDYETLGPAVIAPDTARRLAVDLRYGGTVLPLREDRPGWRSLIDGTPLDRSTPEDLFLADPAAYPGDLVMHRMAVAVLWLLGLGVVALVVVLGGRETRADLAMLRVLGARRGLLRRYAGAQGLLVGLAGVALGGLGVAGLAAAFLAHRAIHFGAPPAGALAGAPWGPVALFAASLAAMSWVVGLVLGARFRGGPPPRRGD
ncbi:FtsX-like permease family protein [Corynebacterium sphenisci]|uniref:FtsX-like permease family protein n=1 Tax=Corynebacterium sphenisci TaxID=191493 RepID=UPI0009527AE5|nr:ABC transporter permease [Corynebacterium sphenisci]